jgi:hypothetical protein
VYRKPHPHWLRAVCPYSGETIGLQFNAYLERVRFSLAGGRLLCLRHPWQDTKLVLHVMADLMRDYVGLGKLAGVAIGAATEFVLKVVEKGSVEIDTLVARQ